MVKDNHLSVLTRNGGTRPYRGIARGARRSAAHDAPLRWRVDRADQIEPVLAAGVDTIMLDNFSVDELRAGVQQVAGRALIEASGGVLLETVGAIAQTGVDIISVGALTHSVRSLDLGLDVIPSTQSTT